MANIATDARDRTKFRRSFCKEFKVMPGAVYNVDISSFNPDYIVTAAADTTSMLVDTMAITEKMNTNKEPRANQQRRLKGHHKQVFSARFLQLRSADKAEEAKRHGKIESHIITHSADGTACLYECDGDGTPVRTYIMPATYDDASGVKKYFTCTMLIMSMGKGHHCGHREVMLAASNGDIFIYRTLGAGRPKGYANQQQLNRHEPTIDGKVCHWKAHDLIIDNNLLIVSCSDGVVRSYRNAISAFQAAKWTAKSGAVNFEAVGAVSFKWTSEAACAPGVAKPQLKRRYGQFPAANTSVAEGNSLFVGYSSGDVIKFDLLSGKAVLILRVGKGTKISKESQVDPVYSLAIPHHTKGGKLVSSGALLLGKGNLVRQKYDAITTGAHETGAASKNVYGMELFETRTGKHIHPSQWFTAIETPWHAGAVHKVAFVEMQQADPGADAGAVEYRVATASADGAVRLFQFVVKNNAAPDDGKFCMNDVPYVPSADANSPSGASDYVDDSHKTVQAFYGHRVDLTNATISSGNRYVVACGTTPEIIKYDMLTGAVVGIFDSRKCPGASIHTSGQINDVYLTPNDEFLLTLSASTLGTVAIWDFAKHQLIAQLGVVEGAQWRGHYAAANESEYEEFGGTGQVPHCIYIYTAADDGQILRWDATATITEYRKAKEHGSSLSFQVQELAPQPEVLDLGHVGEKVQFFSICLSKRSRNSASAAKYLYAVGNQYDVCKFSIQDGNEQEPFGEVIQRFKGHRGEVNAVTLTSDEKYIVSGSDDTDVLAFLADSGEVFRTYASHNQPVVSVRMTPKDEYVISATTEGITHIDDFYTANTLRRIQLPGAGVCRALKVTTDIHGDQEMAVIEHALRKASSAFDSDASSQIAVCGDCGDRSFMGRVRSRGGGAVFHDFLDKMTLLLDCAEKSKQHQRLERSVLGLFDRHQGLNTLKAECRRFLRDGCTDAADKAHLEWRRKHLKRTSASETHLLLAVDDRVKTVDLCGNTEEVTFGNSTAGNGRVLRNSLQVFEPVPADCKNPTGYSFAIVVEADRLATTSAVKVFDQNSTECVYDSGKETEFKDTYFAAGCLWRGCARCGTGCQKGCTNKECSATTASVQWFYIVGMRSAGETGGGRIQGAGPTEVDDWCLAYLSLDGLENGQRPQFNQRLATQSQLSHLVRICAVATTKDFALIATGDDMGRACILDTANRKASGIRVAELFTDTIQNEDVYETAEDVAERSLGDHSSLEARSGSRAGVSLLTGASQDGSEKTTHDNSAITALQFYQGVSSTALYLFSAGEDGSVKQWGRGHGNWVQVAAYGEDPAFMASLDDDVLSAFKKKAYIGGTHQKASVYGIAITSNRTAGAVLATAESNGTTRLYKILHRDPSKTKRKRARPVAHPAARFQPNAVDDTKSVEIVWDNSRKAGCVLVGGDNGMLSVFEFNNKMLTAGIDPSVVCMAYDPKFKVVRPEYTMRFNATITSLAVYEGGSARLIVGIDRISDRVPGKKSRSASTSGAEDSSTRPNQATLHSLPQLHCLLFDKMIPAGFLRRMALVDASDEDPQNRFENAKKAIKQTSPAHVTLTSSDFFVDLAREGIMSGLKKLLFDLKDDIPSVTVPFSGLITTKQKAFEAAKKRDSNNYETFFGSANVDWGGCTDLLLDELAASVKNHNDVLRGHAKPALMYSRFFDGGSLVRTLATDSAVRANLVQFLDKLPLMIAPKAVRGVSDFKVTVDRGRMLTQTCPGLVTLVWQPKSYKDAVKRRARGSVWISYWAHTLFVCAQEKLGGPVRDDVKFTAKTLVCPLAGFAARDNRFLEQILHMRDPHTFGNASVVAMIQVKWDRFGCIWHRRFLMLHLLQIVVVMWISIERHGDTEAHSSNGLLVPVLHVILAVGIGVSFVCEALQFWYGLTSYDYFASFFNYLDVLRIVVTTFAVYTFFQSTGLPADAQFDYTVSPADFTYDVCMAVSIFLHWFGLLDVLKGLPDIGVVVEMMFQAVYDLAYYVLVMFFLIVASSSASRMLYTHSPSHLPGHTDFPDGVVTSYKALVLGDLIGTEELDEELWIRLVASTLLITTSFLVTIIILNLIIAKLSDSYKSLDKLADMARHRYQASMIYWIEGSGLAHLLDHTMANEGAQAWLHVLAPRTTVVMDHGRWGRPNEEVTKETKTLHKRIDTLNSKTQRKLDRMEVRLSNAMDQMSARLATLQDTVAPTNPQPATISNGERVTNRRSGPYADPSTRPAGERFGFDI